MSHDGNGMTPGSADTLPPPAPGDAGVNNFAPGREADYPCGVLYVAEYETPGDGTAVAARLHARALAATGIPLCIQSFSHVVVRDGVPEPVHAVGIPASVKAEVGHLRDVSIAISLPIIKHLVVRNGEHLRQSIIPRGVVHGDLEKLAELRRAVYNATIAFTVWERSGVSAEIVRQLRNCAECWVPCSQNARMLIESGVPEQKVVVMPHPYDPTDSILKLVNRKPSLDWRLFYSIGRWEPRKGQHELIGAFLRTFRRSENALLTLKYSGGVWQNYPPPAESLDRWLADARVQGNGWDRGGVNERIRLVPGSLPRDQILKLHFLHNIYVSAGHGEAYGLPASEAKLAGNRMVYVDWGGPSDFADRDFDIAVPVREPDDLVQVPESYGWEPGVTWAGFDVDALGAAMRAAEPPPVYRQPKQLMEDCSLAAVGRRMADRVLGVATRVAPAAGAYLAGQRVDGGAVSG